MTSSSPTPTSEAITRVVDFFELRTHQGRYCYGKTPIQTFLDAVPAAREKQIGDQVLATASA